MSEGRERREQDVEAQLRLRHVSTTVLLAEDNPINAEVALDLLKDVGLAVDLAEDGQAAVERALGGGCDLVLLGMELPRMDGPAAARAIRARPELAHLPILAMTNDPAGDRDACLAAGMNDLVAMPLDPPALYAALLRHLDAAKRGGGNPGRAGARGVGSAEAAHAAIGQIPGLDVAKGLRYAAGKWPLYASLLGMLTQDNRDDVERLRAQLAAGDAASAMRIAHSLKSTGATVGADELSRRAALVEQAIRAGAQGAENFGSLCVALEDELARLCAAIRPCLNGILPPATE